VASELLIAVEEDKAARAVVFGPLRKWSRGRDPTIWDVVGGVGLAQMALQSQGGTESDCLKLLPASKRSRLPSPFLHGADREQEPEGHGNSRPGLKQQVRTHG
jgi:hypothetical protein